MGAHGGDLDSNSCLVAVEGCDMKHVTVGANSDRLYLAISRQWSRMRRAARAEDLKWQINYWSSRTKNLKCIHCAPLQKIIMEYLSTAPTVMLPADDSEGSLAGDAGVACIIRDPVWRVWTEPRKGKKKYTNSRTVTMWALAERGGKRSKLTCILKVGLFLDSLTFELPLPGFGCQFRGGNGLLTQSTVLQHRTSQNRACWG